jgi:Uncharacterized protein conserved in bacteria
VTSATLLLPATAQLATAELPPPLARALARADLQLLGGDSRQQLSRHFPQLLAADTLWPVAALTRQFDAGDAGDGRWLRADPAFVAADMQGVRMLAHGPALALDAGQVQQLIQAIAPVFAEQGMALSAPTPERWYLQLPAGLELPVFADIDNVLGDDLFDHLPGGDAGRLWRSLLSETQVLLHQHPYNRQRASQGLAMVNSLWFWGPGSLPAQVPSAFAQVRSPDPLLQAIAALAGQPEGQGQLVDLRHLRQPQVMIEQALLPLLGALERGELSRLNLDFADGHHYQLNRGQRWRLWRKPQTTLVR